MTRSEQIELIEEEAACAISRMEKLRDLVDLTNLAFSEIIDEDDLTTARELMFTNATNALTDAAVEIASAIRDSQKAFACAEEDFDASVSDSQRDDRLDAEADHGE